MGTSEETSVGNVNFYPYPPTTFTYVLSNLTEEDWEKIENMVDEKIVEIKHQSYPQPRIIRRHYEDGRLVELVEEY